MRKRRGADCVRSALDVMNRGGVVNNPSRARTRVVGLGSSPTEILKESLLDLPRRRHRPKRAPAQQQCHHKRKPLDFLNHIVSLWHRRSPPAL